MVFRYLMILELSITLPSDHNNSGAVLSWEQTQLTQTSSQSAVAGFPPQSWSIMLYFIWNFNNILKSLELLNAKHRIKFYLLCEVKNGSFEASNCSEFSWRHILLTRRSLTNSWPHGLGGNRFLPTWSWPRMVTVANGSDRLIAASDWFPTNRRSLGESPRLSLLTLLAIGARAALPLREHEPWANH